MSSTSSLPVEQGDQVTPYSSPEEALENYGNQEDLVITDYLFNNQLTGIDVAEQVETPTILYTGYQKEFVERDSQKELPENAEHLIKGSGYQELIEEVEKAMK